MLYFYDIEPLKGFLQSSFTLQLENTYYLLKIDPQMTLVVIFERAKMEKDPQISGFLLEMASLLRCTKIFASLKPGFK